MLYIYIKKNPTRIQLDRNQEKVDVVFGTIIEGTDLEKHGFIRESELKEYVNNKIKGKQEEIKNNENSKAYDVEICETTYKTQMNYIKEKFDKILGGLNEEIKDLNALLNVKPTSLEELQSGESEEVSDTSGEERGYAKQRKKG